MSRAGASRPGHPVAAAGGVNLARRPVLALVTVAVLVGSCDSAASPSGLPLPTARPSVELTMDEYRFHLPPTVPAGQVVFQVRNTGRLPHRLALVPLPDDLPPLDAQLRGSERRALTPFAGVPTRWPGGLERGTFAAVLAPGVRYGLVCFVVDPDGESHAQKGMSAEFRAAAGAGDATQDSTRSGQ